MTDEQKQRMLLEERYADIRVLVRNAYVEYKYVSSGKKSEKSIEELRTYLQSLKTELEELEVKLGDRAKLLYGNDDDWWIS